MKWAVLPVLLLLAQATSAATIYEVQGYLSSYSASSIDRQAVEDYIQKSIAPSLPNAVVTVTLIRDIPNNPTVNFVAEVESSTNLERYEAIQGFEATGTVHPITVIELASPSKSSLRTVADVSGGCKNDGFRLTNGTCDCKPFTSGNNCETVHCQSSSILSVDGTHCHCPPGYSADHCEQTGARPPVEGNFDLQYRSFVVVISINPSYWSQKKTITSNLQSTVAAMQANEQGYIDSYIGVLILGPSPGGIAMANIQTRSLTDFVNFLDTVNITSPAFSDDPQPILYAINNALSTNELLRSHPVVLVFANREDTNPTRPSESIDDYSQETKLRQIVLAWHAKIYFFISKDPNYNLDTSSNGYNAYRRIATASHGDLIAHDPSELTMLMQSFIPRLYKPEITSLMSYVPWGLVSMDINKDYWNQTVTVTVSIDRNQASDVQPPVQLYLTNGAGVVNPEMRYQGQFVRLFTLPTAWTSISLTATANVTVSVRMFVSSNATFVFSYSPSQAIDNGMPNNIAEYPNYIHARAINVPAVYSLAEQYLTSYSGMAMYARNFGHVRDGDWNMNYEFTNVQNCQPGTYTQKFIAQSFTNALNITRMYPGYCFKSVFHPNVQPVGPTFSPPTQLATNESCYRMNIEAVGDQRLQPFKQIMFAVEVSQQMNSSYIYIINMISALLTSLTGDQTKRTFSLLMFNENGAYVAVNSYSAMDFFQSLYPELVKAKTAQGNPMKTMSLDAIYLASQLIQAGPAQLNVFTTTVPAGSNHNWILPRNMQVNWYYISPSFFIPNYTNMRLMEKQSGGRTVVSSPAQINGLSDVILDSIYDYNLVFDGGYLDCSKGEPIVFFMDHVFQRMTLTLLGRDIRIVSLLDGANNTVTIDPADISFHNIASMILQIDKQGNYAGGKWTLVMATSTGSCYCQTRVMSDFGIVLGFTSDTNNDMVAQQPMFRRGYADSYIMARVVDKNNLYTVDQVVALEENIDQPWVTTSQYYAISYLFPRDANSCAYQYRSSLVQLPTVNYLRVMVYLSYNKTTSIERVFFYNTPYDPNAKTQGCNYGAPNMAGECQCAPWYTGELCDQPICQNGGINSNGVCDCADSGFFGTFCDKVVADDTHIVTAGPPVGGSTTTTRRTPITQNTPRPNGVTLIGGATSFMLIFAMLI